MSLTGCSRNSNDVTTPKFPPPPRIAQKRSSFSPSLATWNLPSAVTTSAETRLSQRQPEPTREVADAAAEREPADAGGRDDAAGGRQAERIRRRVEVAPRGAALGPRRLVAGSTRTPRMPRQVDDDAAVARAESRHAVPAAAHRRGPVRSPGRSRPPPSRRRRSPHERRPQAAGRSWRCRPPAPPRTRHRRVRSPTHGPVLAGRQASL